MSEQYPGGFITKSPPTPDGPYETDSAYGIWNLSQQAAYQAQGLWPTAGSNPPDSQFNYVTMLLHGDGTNGAQNNTFLDSSTNNFTITRNGNTTQGSFSPYGSNWANYFDGATGTRLQIPTATNLDAGAGDFCLECWFNGSKDYSAYSLTFASIAGKGSGAQAGTFGLGVYTSKVYAGLYGGSLTGTTTLQVGTWYHVAVTRSGSTIRLFVNGVLEASGTNATDLTSSANFAIGDRQASDPSAQYPFNGYVSNLRLVKGSAVYTSTFTPSTVPLTAISGTQLLTCQSNRFVDNSSNAYTLTPSNSPSVQRFNPFGESVAYSTATYGGSGYFDGSGDYLDITASGSEFNFGTGNLTIEFWAQQLADTYYQGVACFTYNAGSPDNGYLDIELSPGRGFYINADALSLLCQSSAAVTAGDRGWHHWAICRSGTTWYLFKDGVALTKNVDTIGGANLTGTNGCIVGAQTGSGSSPAAYYFNGNLCDFRVIKGTALYTSAFTPPTVPLTAVANTQLLTNFTNGAIYDNAMINNLETVGTAQISTSVKKYGTGSISLNGSTDYLVGPNTPNTDFGTGNFTVEGWFNWTTDASGGLVAKWGPGATYAWLIDYVVGSHVLRFYTGNNGGVGTSFTFSFTPTTGQWYHIAFTRSGTSLRCFVNGTQVGSTGTTSENMAAVQNIYVGTNINNGTYFPGYMDDVRITKGYARYTTTFTPPTAAFPNIGPT